MAVGFTPDTFIIKNSWGASWGDKGYMTISRGLNTCRVSDYVYYPVVRASDEPTNEPPTFVPTPDPSKPNQINMITKMMMLKSPISTMTL